MVDIDEKIWLCLFLMQSESSQIFLHCDLEVVAKLFHFYDMPFGGNDILVPLGTYIYGLMSFTSMFLNIVSYFFRGRVDCLGNLT